MVVFVFVLVVSFSSSANVLSCSGVVGGVYVIFVDFDVVLVTPLGFMYVSVAVIAKVLL